MAQPAADLRIVTLLPSATEIVAAVGLLDNIVGVSHECDFPAAVIGRPQLTEAKLNPFASAKDIHKQVNGLVQQGLSVYRVFDDRLKTARPAVVITQVLC